MDKYEISKSFPEKIDVINNITNLLNFNNIEDFNLNKNFYNNIIVTSNISRGIDTYSYKNSNYQKKKGLEQEVLITNY